MYIDGDGTIHTINRAETVAVGVVIGQLLQPGDLICLSGDLGAGKTAITSGIASGWGAQERVSSPTFTFVHEHHHAIDSTPLYHLDCYRFSNPAGADSIGLDDLLDGRAILIIEWAERIALRLPLECLTITLEQDEHDDSRRIIFQPQGNRYHALMQAVFVQQSGVN